MKGIVYSLFGYERGRAENCFDFNSYLRGLMICLRMNTLIYPDWKTVLETDENTYNGFKTLFDKLIEQEIIIIEINKNNTKLCEAMLWRLKPIFWKKNKFTHILCRDLVSPATYREAQAVNYWVNQREKAMHAITDSISHDVALMGGMIGIMPEHFIHKTSCYTFEDLMKKSNIDYSTKGSDQVFLNQNIYPMFAQKGNDSITQHYVLGFANTFLSDWHNEIEDIDIGLPIELKETNDICGHIGSAGWYEPIASKLIYKYKSKFYEISEAEKEYPQIFYWGEINK